MQSFFGTSHALKKNIQLDDASVASGQNLGVIII
jgi:hypothetical protein